MRSRALFLLVLLTILVAACHRHARARDAGDRSMRRSRGAPVAYAEDDGPTPCEASCGHYLECRGLDDEQLAPCVSRCERLHYSARDHANYQRTDCATAIQIVEGGGNSGGGSQPRSSDCNGCVWDGSACIWLSQSNWGAGPYSGAALSCASSCCGR